MHVAEHAPDSVDEHRVAGRTLNTAWGEQMTVNTSSGVNGYAEFESTSASIDLDIATRVGAEEPTACSGRLTWNANGTGSS